ncbi:hypothetical protein K3495_g2387 [Podosphaera aphanis]|nr:hypothetical protein K3495_g2387 [Podosphaera aphanis]
MRKLTLDQTSSVTTLFNESKKVEEVSGIVGGSKSTTAKFRGKLLDHTSSAYHGRPGKLTSQDKRALARLIVNGGTKTAVEAARTINLDREDKISPDIVR